MFFHCSFYFTFYTDRNFCSFSVFDLFLESLHLRNFSKLVIGESLRPQSFKEFRKIQLIICLQKLQDHKLLIITLASERYKRSPHTQGSMEIPCKVIATILGTCLNLIQIKRYKKLIEGNSTESKYENIVILCLHTQKERKEAREA